MAAIPPPVRHIGSDEPGECVPRPPDGRGPVDPRRFHRRAGGAGASRDSGSRPARRYFMVEHLASYTRVMSGPVWVRRGDRWRRQRFSELDAARLAAALDAVPESDRPGIYRRLGDLALFL